MSGSGHPTNSPFTVKKDRIWRSGGWHFHYLVCYFESSLVHAKKFFQRITINIFLERTKFTVLDVYHMKCKSFNRYDKQNPRNKKNYPPIYQKSLKVLNRPTDWPIRNPLKWPKPNYFESAAKRYHVQQKD